MHPTPHPRGSGRLRRLVCCGVALAGMTAGTPTAAEPSEGRRAVQLEYDPQTGRWVELEPPQPGTPAGDLAVGRRNFAAGNLSSARRRFKAWLKEHGTAHALSREVRLELARCEHALGNYHRAQEILQELIVQFGSDPVTAEALELQFNIAEVFLAGKKRKWLGMRLLPASELGIKILDDITADYPDTALAERALKTKADHYFKRGDFDLAEDEYGRLISAFPRSRWLMWAHLRRARAALARFPGTPFDDGALIEAEERFLQFSSGFPQAARQHDVELVLEDIRNRRALKDLETGHYYLKVDQAQAAAYYFRSVLQNWPGTTAAVRARALLAAMGQLGPAES